MLNFRIPLPTSPMESLSSLKTDPMNAQVTFAAIVGGLLIASIVTTLRKRPNDVDKLRKPVSELFSHGNSLTDAHRPPQPGAHWLWGHDLDAWETPDSGWYTQNLEEHGLVFAMRGALFVSESFSIRPAGV